MKNLKKIIYILIILLVGCNANKKNIDDKKLLDEYFKKKIKINNNFDDEIKVIDFKIKNQKLQLLKNNIETDSSYFEIFDLKSNTKTTTIKNNLSDYISIAFDLEDDKIYASSSNNNNKYKIYDLLNGKITSDSFNLLKENRAEKIHVNKNQIFLFNDIYGFNIIKKSNKENIINTGNFSAKDLRYSQISYPISDEINLLSEYFNNNLCLYGIDKDGLKWNIKYPCGSISDFIQILSIGEKFVVKLENEILVLNKTSGEILKTIKSDNLISNIFMFDTSLIYVSLNNLTNKAYGEENVYIVKVNFLNLNKNKEIWYYEIKSEGIPSIALSGDMFLLGLKKKLIILSNKSGKKTTETETSSDYWFNSIIDTRTGKYYLVFKEDYIFW